MYLTTEEKRKFDFSQKDETILHILNEHREYIIDWEKRSNNPISDKTGELAFVALFRLYKVSFPCAKEDECLSVLDELKQEGMIYSDVSTLHPTKRFDVYGLTEFALTEMS